VLFRIEQRRAESSQFRELKKSQRAHSFDLFQQRHLRITLLRQFLDALVVLADLLAQRLSAEKNFCSAVPLRC